MPSFLQMWSFRGLTPPESILPRVRYRYSEPQLMSHYLLGKIPERRLCIRTLDICTFVLKAPLRLSKSQRNQFYYVYNPTFQLF